MFNNHFSHENAFRGIPNRALSYKDCTQQLEVNRDYQATATRTVTFVDNTVLTASQLNNEFDNLLGALALVNADISGSAAISISKISTGLSGSIVGTTDTQTLTNKRVTRRVGTVADAATITPTADDSDVYTVTALAQAATIAAPSGTPTNGQTLILRILDNGTARGLTFDSIYRFSTDLAAPTTTVLSKTLYLGFIYNSAATKWDCVALLNNF